MLAPGQMAGRLSATAAARLGLTAGTPISTAIIDAHAGVPGAGVARPGELVLVLGTSGCHMVMAERELHIPGVAGVVADGILPGYYGYETGQAAVGDAFDWVRRLCGERDHESLESRARSVAPGSDGLLVVDWFNGCRTPLMDGALTGAILGASLHHTPAHLYRATLEASACGVRWIVETLRDGGVPIERVVATGGLPHGNRLFIEMLASVLGEQVEVHPATHGPALGAAILGALSAGRFESAEEAISAMAGAGSALPPNALAPPDRDGVATYDDVYRRYRLHAEMLVRGADRAPSWPAQGAPNGSPIQR
jgi:L-ribulokinase